MVIVTDKERNMASRVLGPVFRYYIDDNRSEGVVRSQQALDALSRAYAERDQLKQQLAQARDDGLEEAARVAMQTYMTTPLFEDDRRYMIDHIVDAIRARKSDKQTKPGDQ